jgi:serine/threonine protein kinase
MKIPGYKVHRKIGKGGMASVFLATQECFDRKVALKIIADSAFGHQHLADRFVREAKIVASFSHPHIVPVYDVGHIEQFHYLSMDFLQGGELSQWIRAGLSPEETEQIIIQVAQALHYAHNKGYIHRDVKPDNILFREDNSAVLTDFGIAQPINTNLDDNRASMVVGTPSYMSPEQSQGKAIDARTDLYSLGIMFYQMLTKQLPFTADNYKELALKHIQQPIPKLPFAINRYQPLINKLLAKEPQQRFQSALQFIKALNNLGEYPDLSEINTSIAELSLVATDAAIENKNAAQTDFNLDEKTYRKLGLAKRYSLEGKIYSKEAQHFLILFSRLTTRLIEWQQLRGKSCGKFQLECTIDPMIEEMARNRFQSLFQDCENFNFLSSIQTEITFTDSAGKQLSKLTF